MNLRALEYAAQGWPVMPLHTPTSFGPKEGEGRASCSCKRPDCTSQGKHPRTPTGLKAATTDTAQVAKWWAMWPDANIGLATGRVFDVLDLDGETAVDILDLVTPDEVPPGVLDGPRSITGNGVHFFLAPTGEGNRTDLGAKGSGIDWRGAGGYVVAPPSLHYLHGDRYEWDAHKGLAGQRFDLLHPLPVCADWLLHLVKTCKPAPNTEAALRRKVLGLDAPKNKSRTRGSVATREGTTPYGRAILERAAGELRAAREGGRNHALNSAALCLGHYVAGGEIVQNDAESVLWDCARAIGLEGGETLETIKSGMTAGLKEPQSAPLRTSSYSKFGGRP